MFKKTGDSSIGLCVFLPDGNWLMKNIVTNRKRDLSDTRLIGKASNNPVADTRIYSVTFFG